jgi:hypothetical protein
VRTSIRLRVALGVFLVVAGLVTLQDLYVLSRFERARLETDGQLDVNLRGECGRRDRPATAVDVAATEEHRDRVFISSRGRQRRGRSGRTSGRSRAVDVLETSGTRY